MGPASSVTVNEEPLPSSLSTDTSPPGQLGQPPADDQPQPGAAEAAGRGSVGLGDWLEQARRLFGRQADPGVGDDDPERSRGRKSIWFTRESVGAYREPSGAS